MRSENAHWGGVACAGCLATMTLILPFLGCGESLPTTIPVRGRVTWQGKPVPMGTVTFQPTETGPGAPLRPAVAEIAPDGTYQLSCFRTHDGAMPGEYVVTIRASTPPPMEAGVPRPRWLLPPKYANAGTSGLSRTIPADAEGELVMDFDLKK